MQSIQELIAPLERWTDKEQTQAEVEVRILDHLYEVLPTPPFTDDEQQLAAKRVYQHFWQQSGGSGRGRVHGLTNAGALTPLSRADRDLDHRPQRLQHRAVALRDLVVQVG